MKQFGFFISIPNYNNLVYNLNLYKILKVLKTKKKPQEYIMLYMGVSDKHRGLGSAIVKTMIDELKENRVASIGALIKHGKATNNYVKGKIVNQFEYVLLKRKIES